MNHEVEITKLFDEITEKNDLLKVKSDHILELEKRVKTLEEEIAQSLLLVQKSDKNILILFSSFLGMMTLGQKDQLKNALIKEFNLRP